VRIWASRKAIKRRTFSLQAVEIWRGDEILSVEWELGRERREEEGAAARAGEDQRGMGSIVIPSASWNGRTLEASDGKSNQCHDLASFECWFHGLRFTVRNICMHGVVLCYISYNFWFLFFFELLVRITYNTSGLLFFLLFWMFGLTLLTNITLP
jgi:hypothetical protein